MRRNYKKFSIPTNRGLTLIEIMVSVTIFTIVVAIGLGALLSVNRVHQETRAARSAVDNLNFAVEGMVRQIRIGSTYHCGSDSPLDVTENCHDIPKDSFAFELFEGDPNDDEDQMIYRLAHTQGPDSIGYIERGKSSGSNPFLPITSNEVDITRLSFYVHGAGTADSIQPSVRIVIEGISQVGKREESFALQTMVSQRVLDLRNNITPPVIP